MQIQTTGNDESVLQITFNIGSAKITIKAVKELKEL